MVVAIAARTLDNKRSANMTDLCKLCTFENITSGPAHVLLVVTRDRRDQKFRDDTDTDTLWGPESRPILILIP